MHGWFCQLELIEPLWQKKVELRESSNMFLIGYDYCIAISGPANGKRKFDKNPVTGWRYPYGTKESFYCNEGYRKGDQFMPLVLEMVEQGPLDFLDIMPPLVNVRKFTNYSHLWKYSYFLISLKIYNNRILVKKAL